MKETISRRSFLTRALTLPALYAVSGEAAAQFELRGKRPHILLITTDDQGTTLGCYGDPLGRTPNMDRLAAEGMRFTRAYVTHASCSPSRSSILTGLYPHQNGQIGLAGAHPEYGVKRNIPTLPGILKESGYYNGIIGKLHVTPQEIFPFDFEWWKHQALKTRDVREVARRAAMFFDEAGDRPFFLYVNYFDPHRPYNEEANQYMGLPEDPYTPEEVEPFPYLHADGDRVRREVAGYYNAQRRADAGLGMLLETLREAGHEEDTLIIFLGDHGVPFVRAKTTCYEAGEEVPFLVRWPGVIRPGQVNHDFISSVDILPTILDAAGIAPPAHRAGRSLIPLLTGSTPADWRKTLYGEYTAHAAQHFYPRRSIRDRRYKLIRNLDHTRPNPVPQIGPVGIKFAEDDETRQAYETSMHPPEFELYDLSKDPHEMHNLAGNPEMKPVLERMKAELQRRREETDDPLLDPEELVRLKAAHDL
ncbi:sulfatase [Kiritimatiella glycovorans]|uniref:Arylsulfatase n=1 Tax=Kiritimatiella glycovorans TaxID=1307763 RepID=A0A0G3EE46_9BACT|nr:sulfatase [Kiritimatiella glycovorans]AKJ64731.1 Arylsulfatase [Kiritimatiella glycovorans]